MFCAAHLLFLQTVHAESPQCKQKQDILAADCLFMSRKIFQYNYLFKRGRRKSLVQLTEKLKMATSLTDIPRKVVRLQNTIFSHKHVLSKIRFKNLNQAE